VLERKDMCLANGCFLPLPEADDTLLPECLAHAGALRRLAAPGGSPRSSCRPSPRPCFRHVCRGPRPRVEPGIRDPVVHPCHQPLP
jgi:hypothetical protein